jgi:Na+-driven multidrug efflux pump
VKIFLEIIKDGFMGALIFLLLVGTLAAGTILAGRLPQSQLYVSAYGIGSAYFGFCTSLALGLNAGFNVLVGRCCGLRDYSTLKLFKDKQAIL